MLITPVYGLNQPEGSDYAYQLGDVMGATVARLEEVLSGFVTSPDVSSLNAEVIARAAAVAAVQAQVTAAAPGAWQIPTVTGAGAPVAGYSAARYRKVPAVDSLQLVMVLSGPITAGQVLFTLPTGFRPATHVTIPVLTSATTLGQLDVQSGGPVKCQSAVTAGNFLGFSSMVPLS